MRVEIETGVAYAGAPSARGWVICARRHAVELQMPEMSVPEFNAWCVEVGRRTGFMPMRYFMQGWENIFAGIDNFPGDVARRRVGSRPAAPSSAWRARPVRAAASSWAAAKYLQTNTDYSYTKASAHGKMSAKLNAS